MEDLEVVDPVYAKSLKWMLENDISQITCRENLVKTCFGPFLDNYPDQYPQHTMPVPFFGCVKVNVFEILNSLGHLQEQFPPTIVGIGPCGDDL